jgi:hypothetical protein
VVLFVAMAFIINQGMGFVASNLLRNRAKLPIATATPVISPSDGPIVTHSPHPNWKPGDKQPHPFGDTGKRILIIMYSAVRLTAVDVIGHFLL